MTTLNPTCISVLDRILVVDRVRRQAARVSSGGGFAIPFLQEVSVEAGAAPLLASNMRGSFVPTTVSRGGVARFGLCELDVGEEPALVGALFRSLWSLSESNGWPNRCAALEQLRPRMEALGMEPKTLLVPPSLLAMCGVDMTLEESERLMLSTGHVAEVDGVKVLVASGLQDGTALLTTHPALTGMYTRADVYVGVLLMRVDTAIVMADVSAQVQEHRAVA